MNYSTPQGNNVQLVSEGLVQADKTEESKLYIPDLHESFTAKTAENYGHFAARTLEQPQTSFSYDADGVLIGV